MAGFPSAPLSFPWRKVAFVADRFEPQASDLLAESRHDLEKTDPTTVADVMSAIERLGLEPIHVESPRLLAERADDLRDAVVFSTFGGETSRNRLLLVPAVAEAMGLDFVGLDAVGHALAANKNDAKRLAAQCGVTTPLSRMIRDEADLALCDAFPLPYVVKPVAEGSSIGIGPQNLIRHRGEGRRVAAELLDRFHQPVLVEAFVPGREASLVCIEGPSGVHSALVEIVVAGVPGFFDEHLFDAEEKLSRHLPRSVHPIAEALAIDDAAAIARLLRAIGHFGYCRVDGKLHDGRFHFLELTPDAWLGREGQLAAGFRAQGWTYEDVISAILRSATLRPRGRAANG